MPSSQKRIGLILWLGALWATWLPSPVHAALESDPSLNVLTQAVQVLRLTPGEATRRYPVQISGVVTCFDQRALLCFVQDPTAGVYVYNQNPAQKFNVGDQVEVTGVTDPGQYSPFVHWAIAKVTGKSPLPAPKVITIEQLASGREDSQWVEVEGVVHRAIEDWGHLVLDVVAGSHQLKVRIVSYPPGEESRLTDARVRIHGVAGTFYNNRRQLTGFHLLVPSMDHVTALSQPQADPFVGPIQLNRSLLSYSRDNEAGRRVRVRGVVTLHWPGQALFLQDESGGLQVQSDDTPSVSAGDVIEAVGFPALGGYTPSLKNAIVRKVDTGRALKPAPITAATASSGLRDKDLVELAGELLALNEEHPGRKTLVLRQAKTVFQACLPAATNTDGKGFAYPIGSRLAVSGVCSVGIDERGKPSSFSVWMRSPSDVAVLQRPKWWTLSRLMPAVAGLGLVFAVGLLWVGSLRQSVQRQTGVLRRREAILEDRYRDLFENANDIIYTLDLSGRLAALNKAGEQLLGYSREQALNLRLADLAVPDQRESLLRHIQQTVSGEPRIALEVEVVAKDETRLFLEASSRPNYHEGRLIGIQGIARDITARKQAETDLRESERQLRASLEERERIGRDLHDGLIQSIYAVGLNLEDCRRGVQDHPADLERRLGEIVADLNAVILDVRSFIVGLESHSLRGQEFKAALKSLILTLGETHSLQFSLHIDSAVAETLSPKQATELLHIAREAVSNSLRHAQAKRTTLSLQFQKNQIHFEVRDDGIGFDARVVSSHGHGLRNMAARATELGAHFTTHSQPGQGTRIALDISRETLKPSIEE